MISRGTLHVHYQQSGVPTTTIRFKDVVIKVNFCEGGRERRREKREREEESKEKKKKIKEET